MHSALYSLTCDDIFAPWNKNLISICTFVGRFYNYLNNAVGLLDVSLFSFCCCCNCFKSVLVSKKASAALGNVALMVVGGQGGPARHTWLALDASVVFTRTYTFQHTFRRFQLLSRTIFFSSLLNIIHNSSSFSFSCLCFAWPFSATRDFFYWVCWLGPQFSRQTLRVAQAFPLRVFWSLLTSHLAIVSSTCLWSHLLHSFLCVHPTGYWHVH